MGGGGAAVQTPDQMRARITELEKERKALEGKLTKTEQELRDSRSKLANIEDKLKQANKRSVARICNYANTKIDSSSTVTKSARG